jgi:hypothetical protein
MTAKYTVLMVPELCSNLYYTKAREIKEGILEKLREFVHLVHTRNVGPHNI